MLFSFFQWRDQHRASGRKVGDKMSYLIKQNELLGRQLDDSFKKNEVMQDGIKQKIKGRQLIMHG